MKITQIRTGLLSVPLRTPFKTALRTVTHVNDVIVEIHTNTGCVGYGEAPSTGVITGDTRGSVRGAIEEHIRPALLGRDVGRILRTFKIKKNVEVTDNGKIII